MYLFKSALGAQVIGKVFEPKKCVLSSPLLFLCSTSELLLTGDSRALHTVCPSEGVTFWGLSGERPILFIPIEVKPQLELSQG